MLAFVPVRQNCDLIGDALRGLQPVKSAKQRADVVEPRRREYQPGGCIRYRLKECQEDQRIIAHQFWLLVLRICVCVGGPNPSLHLSPFFPLPFLSPYRFPPSP